MKNTIICKNCGAKIEISEAIAHEMVESALTEERQKHEDELKKVSEQAEKKILERLQKDFQLKLTNLEKEKEEEKLRNKALLTQLESLNDELRALRRKDEEREYQMKKHIVEEEKKIKASASREAIEKSSVEISELKKQIDDYKKSLDEANYKLSQKSQQLQGEVMELDLEKILKQTFPDDEINPIGKGQQGGDIIQKVKGKSGKVAGVILWESKNAKWTPSWLAKLREDSRKSDASVSVLISTNLPKEIDNFRLTEGVVVSSYKYALPLAGLLRRSILQIAVAKQTAANKDEKLELLYEYLQSESFRHRFEAFAEGVVEMQSDLDYEKRAMERVWKKREVQIKRTLINASRMYGELQGVMGNSLPDIKSFRLEDGKGSAE